MEPVSHDLSYYRMYLEHLRQERGDAELTEEFVSSRCDAAEAAFTRYRKQGLDVGMAHALAMEVLLSGIDLEGKEVGGGIQ